MLAYVLKEPGEEVVAGEMSDGLFISAVNLAEVLSKLADRGADSQAELGVLTVGGVIDGTLTVMPFTEDDALASAALRRNTSSAGLSLADRGCLALAQRLGLPALTADRAWATLDVGIAVQLIR